MFYGDFRWNGNLKPGIEDQTPAGFFRKYVIPFPFSATRGWLFRSFVDYLKELESFGIMRGLFVAGSFVTLKENPHDVDVICCFSGELFDGLPDGEASRAMKLLADQVGMMRRYGVQPFPLPVYAPDDERCAVTRFATDFILGILGTDRQDSPKGLVHMDWTDIGQALAGGEMEPFVRFCGSLPSRPGPWTPLYGKSEEVRRRHLRDTRDFLAAASELTKRFPELPSLQVLVHFLFCGLFLILGGGDLPPEQDR